MSRLGKMSIAVFCAVTCISAAAAERDIIAVFGDGGRKTDTPPVWQHLWNAKGEIGNSSNYVPLTYVKESKLYAVVSDTGKVQAPRDGFVAGYKRDPVVRHTIYAYTLATNYSGHVWVNNGNLQSRLGSGTGVVLSVYLNDQMKFSAAVKKGREPYLFQCDFGELKTGDTLYFAVGPQNRDDTSNFFGLRFVLELLPAGSRPPEPVNTLSPSVQTPTPPRTADGECAGWYRQIHQAHCAYALTNKPGLVFMGDSITAGWPRKMLDERFGKYRPANMGIGGDWVQNVLWRVLNGVLDQVKPKGVVLMIGTNNIGNGYEPGDVAVGIAEILKALRQKTPDTRILLLGIFPRGTSIHDNPTYEKIKQVNAAIAKLADGRAVTYLNINDQLVESDGTISKDVLPDGLHPGEKGYRIWADAIAPTLDRLMFDQP